MKKKTDKFVKLNPGIAGLSGILVPDLRDRDRDPDIVPGQPPIPALKPLILEPFEIYDYHVNENTRSLL